jgi:hypothetical protein
MLDIFLALDRLTRRRKHFEMNQLIYSILLGMAANEFALMFMNAANKIIRNADIERPTWPTREDVDVKAAHLKSLENWKSLGNPGGFCFLVPLRL